MRVQKQKVGFDTLNHLAIYTDIPVLKFPCD
ncbi:hypothetical protein PITC_024630 [Penicillium italicum]|uniref:Uncharacterized protein n=1 Tax=Penicillium italicum TaxID=40296 RepID=A0A0A2LNQ2_PENIT|nr:hypothetical protein PITC_024630 [Penicillium italicum]